MEQSWSGAFVIWRFGRPTTSAQRRDAQIRAEKAQATATAAGQQARAINYLSALFW